MGQGRKRMQTRERLVATAKLARVAAPGLLSDLATTIPAVVPNPLSVGDAYELLLQSYLFFGYPQAIEVMRVYSEALQRIGLQSATNGDRPSLQEMRDRGEVRCREIYNPNYERLQDNMAAISPELAEWMLIEGYGKVLSRPGPSKLEREIASIVFLACSRHPIQLFSHVRGARNLGADAQLLREIISATELTHEQSALVEETIGRVFAA